MSRAKTISWKFRLLALAATTVLQNIAIESADALGPLQKNNQLIAQISTADFSNRSAIIDEIKRAPGNVWLILDKADLTNVGDKWRFYDDVGKVLSSSNADQDAERAFRMSIKELEKSTSGAHRTSTGTMLAKAQRTPRKHLTELYLKQISQLVETGNNFTSVNKLFKTAVLNDGHSADLWLSYYEFLRRHGRNKEANAALLRYRNLIPLGPISISK